MDCALPFPCSYRYILFDRDAKFGNEVFEFLEASGAPAMYALDQASLAIPLGSTATDFVLVVMQSKGIDAILNGKTKLGADAAAAAGPTAA